MTSLAMSTIREALDTLQKEHEKIIKENKKLQSDTIKLQTAFLAGKTDQLIFDGLYEGGQINVVTLTGKKILINVKYTNTVQDVQQQIYEKECIPIFNQRLVFGGRRLKPHRSLYSYKIPIGAILYLVTDMHPRRVPWVQSDPKEIHDDQYYINRAVTKLIERREFKAQYTNIAD